MADDARDERDLLDAERLRRVLDGSRSATVLVDMTGTVVYASAAIEEIIGVTAERATGVSILEWLHPDDQERAIGALAMNQTPTNIRYFPMVFHLVHADGHLVEVDVLTSNFADDLLGRTVLLSARHADDRTQFVEPIRALAAGADHGLVLELIASGVGRGGHSLRPAFVAAEPDPTTGRFTETYAVRAKDELIEEVRRFLASEQSDSLRTLTPRELRSLGPEQLPASLVAALEQSDSVGLRVGAIAVDQELVGVLLAAEPAITWREGRWMPSMQDHWYQLIDLATVAFERHRAQSLLLHAATHDSLTGLPNRAHFFDQLSRLASRSDVAVLYLDLDEFKNVNDRFGHFRGDAVLVEVAHRMRAALRPGDLVGRLGGDEFAIAVVDRLPTVIAELADRLHASITAKLPTELGVDEIGVSIGYSQLHLGQSVDDLVHQADQALLSAKRAGRNTVVRSPGI